MHPSNPDPQQPVAAQAQRDRHLRRIGRRALVGLTIALAGATTAITVSLEPAQARSETTIKFVSLTKAATMIPTGLIEADVDRNPAGKVIGSDSVNCRNTAPKTPPKCAVTVDLANGDLFLHTTPSPTGVTGSLLDGTGHYANATGTVIAQPVTSTKTNITITIDKL